MFVEASKLTSNLSSICTMRLTAACSSSGVTRPAEERERTEARAWSSSALPSAGCCAIPGASVASIRPTSKGKEGGMRGEPLRMIIV